MPKKNKKNKTYTEPTVMRQVNSHLHWDQDKSEIPDSLDKYVQYSNKPVPPSKSKKRKTNKLVE